MHKITLLAGCALASVAVSACGSTGSSASFADFAKTIAEDPRCGHIDRVQGNLGGLTGNNLAVYLERTCPAGTPPTPPTAPAPAGPPPATPQ